MKKRDRLSVVVHPEGMSAISGGRSAAQTPGFDRKRRSHPEGCQKRSNIRHCKKNALASLRDANTLYQCFPGSSRCSDPANGCHPCGMKTILLTASLCLFAFLAANSALPRAQVARPAVVPPVNPNPDIPARPTNIFPFDDAKDPLAGRACVSATREVRELWNAAHPESRVRSSAPQDGTGGRGVGRGRSEQAGRRSRRNGKGDGSHHAVQFPQATDSVADPAAVGVA